MIPDKEDAFGLIIGCVYTLMVLILVYNILSHF